MQFAIRVASFTKTLSIVQNLVLVLGLIFLSSTFFMGQRNSFFFADDFLGLDLFRDTKGLINLEASAGRPITNIYFFVTTWIFGGNKNWQFLLLNFLVLMAALLLFIASAKKTWKGSETGIVFTICFLILSGSFLPLIFWASNFNHIFSIFILSTILFMYQANLVNPKNKLVIWQSFLYFILITSNPLYSPFLLTGLVSLGFDLDRSNLINSKRRLFLIWNLVIRTFVPIIYIVTISLPFLLSNNQYRLGLFKSTITNLRFYTSLGNVGLAIAMVVLCIILSQCMYMLIRKRDYHSLSLLISGAAILTIVLIQENQQGLHYLVIPVLLMAPVVLQSFNDALKRPALKIVLVMTLFALLLFSFDESKSIRSYFIQTPWGSNLVKFNSEVTRMDLKDSHLCIAGVGKFDDWQNFIAQIGGASFFLRQEIGAKSAVFVNGQQCTLDSKLVTILINQSGENFFTATRQ